MNNKWGEIFFLFHFSIKPVRKKHEIKSFSIVQSIKFYSLTSKLLLQKKSLVTFCGNSQKKRNVKIEILSCDFDSHKTLMVTFLDLTRLRLPKFSWT